LNIDDILNEWAEDSKVDRTELGEASLQGQVLHAKYLRYLFAYRSSLIKLRAQQARLKLLRFEYWSGTLSKEELEEHGWPPQPLKVMKVDLPLYLEADEVLNDVNTKMAFQSEKVNVLESILKTLQNRQFSISNAIKWVQYQSGERF
jgi:hypothetical protein